MIHVKALLAATAALALAAGAAPDQPIGDGLVMYMQMGGNPGDGATLARQTGAAQAAEALGVECKVGIATRPVRVVLLSIGLVFGAGELITDVDLLPAAIYAMAGLTAFTVGQRVWQLAFTPDQKTLISTNGVSNDITFIDVATDEPVQSVTVGALPWGVTVSPN